MMIDGNNKKSKLKANIDEFVGPLLKRISVAKGTPDDKTIEDIQMLIEQTKLCYDIRQNWENEIMGLFGKIERKIDNHEENKGAHNEHTSTIEGGSLQQAFSKIEERSEHTWEVVRENLKELLEKSGVDPSMVSTISQQEESIFSQKTTTYEVGGPSNSINQEGDAQKELKECRKELSSQQKIWLDSLGIFPLQTNLKKRLLVSWWIGLGIVPLEGNPNTMNLYSMQKSRGKLRSEHTSSKQMSHPELHRQYGWLLKSVLRIAQTNLEKKRAGRAVFYHSSEDEYSNSTAEEHGQNFFDYLLQKGILKPIHIRKHNQVIDQCIINPSFHRRLRAAFWWRRLSITYKNAKREGTEWHFDYGSKAIVRALLNVDQKYLNSKYIAGRNILGDNKSVQVVHFGRWRCIDTWIDNRAEKVVSKVTKSQYHIEVDETDFLKKLGENVVFLSLQSISRIDELPESIGKLKNLRILDVRACHNLERLPQKPQPKSLRSKSRVENWFNNLTHLDISECYLLNHMPKWLCELSNLEVFKGFVAGKEGKKDQFCRIGDLSKLKKLRKLSIRIVKHLDPKDARGLESLDWLSVLTVIWSINEDNYGSDKVETISFPKNLEKLDIRCYPEAEAAELLNPTALPKLKRLYIRGGKLVKVANDSNWIVEILRLRFLNDLEIDGFKLNYIFTMLKYVEFKDCLSLKNFPKNRSAWNTMTNGPFPDGPDVKTITAETMPVEVKIVSNNWAPFASNTQKMTLELTSPNSITNRLRLNLVVVLDVSGSMRGEKIKKLKTAMLFVIEKLSSVDRLSIVTFSTEAKVLWPLQEITDYSSRRKLVKKVVNLTATGATNMFAGLQMGLNILKDAEISSQDTVGIILMSDGAQTYGDAALIPIGNVAVHTFGFGKGHDPKVLKSIAYNNIGGTFSDVVNTDNLIKAFAVCLAGLLTVVVQNLTLTLTPIEDVSTIKLVSAGDYVQLEDTGVSPITINFGDLYSGEVRKVLLNLLLPAVDTQGDGNVLVVSHSYMISGVLVKAKPEIIVVRRMQTVSTYKQQVPQDQVIAEEIYMKTVDMIRRAIAMADDNKLELARRYICKLKNALKNLKYHPHGSNELYGLDEDIEELLKMMESEESYRLKGAFAYSLVTSHDRQRMAARGDDIGKNLSFATPLMLKFLEQAEKFAADPNMSLSSLEEDAECIVDANPFEAIS